MDIILANHWGERRAGGYDVVVVGSGYGGAITAARFSNAAHNPKLSVCLLERGQEWPVGQFPDSLDGIVGNSYNPALNRRGLYEFDAFPDVAVIKGSGLGGTSSVVDPTPASGGLTWASKRLAVTKIRYPEWEFAFVDAILEYDPAKARDKALRARAAMTLRLQALTPHQSVERSAILSGLCSLTVHLERITAA